MCSVDQISGVNVIQMILVSLAVLAAIAVTAALAWICIRLYRWQAQRRRAAVHAVQCICIDCMPAILHPEIVPDEHPAIESPESRADVAGVLVREEVPR